MFKSSNPALSESTLKDIRYATDGAVMSLNGTIYKTLFGLLLLFAGGYYSVYTIINSPASANILLLTGAIGGLIAAMVTIFKPQVARYTMPLYAILEGLVLGAASLFIPAYFGAPTAVVGQAILATAVTFFVMLIMYRTRIIKVTETFKGVVLAATFGIAIVYFVLMIMSFFGTGNFLMGTSALSIGVTAFAAVIAALNLAMDFDLIEKMNQMGAPKYMEWYGAFSILVTLVWLYLELLRLFAKLSSSNR
ncbi:MAG: Bax inhibitor-1/YccA family protein [Flavobacteriales bacterium]|nr:Bax inhibitor-1/YccA family protein [Flavobacteriales bacterium]